MTKVKTPIGMRISQFAPIAADAPTVTYGEWNDMGEAVKGYLSVTTLSGDISGDDRTLLRVDQFVSAQLDVETTRSDLELNALVFGHTYGESDEEVSSINDTAPIGAFGYIEPILLGDKSIVFRATFLPRVQAILSSEKSEADTRKNDFNPKMNAVSYFVMPDEGGEWRYRKEFDSLSLATGWLDTKRTGA